MSGGLKINVGHVRTLAESLSTIQRRLQRSEADSESVAGAVHHERLASTIIDFSSQWERRRIELSEQVQVLSEQTGAVSDAFAELDSELANAIEGE